MPGPEIQQRDVLGYAAIATDVTMEEMVAALPQLWPEVHIWIAQCGETPAGAPFIRYRAVPQSGRLAIEVGIPVTGNPVGDERVKVGAFPAGRYAVSVHTGPFDGLGAANAELQSWVAGENLKFQMDGPADDALWGCRTESYLTDPGVEPDPAKWRTEIAYLLAD